MNNPLENPITSPDWRKEKLTAIKHLYPDLFTDEGKISVDELHALAQDYNLSLGEKFEFRWPGKMHAKKSAFTSSKVRLAPDTARSVNFDDTNNVIIEGENLEVLKLLSKAYYNKVKCIYIDPPYNTGHDFVYSDDYSEDKQAYWEKNGVYHDAVKIDTNTESAGRYHTNWLNMMMPRLLLAQMMLKDDGVIFVSIDDNEVHNLRKLMDEVFGEENFVAQITWKARVKPVNIGDSKYRPQQEVDYVIVYQKDQVEGIFKPLISGGVRSYAHTLDGRQYRLTTILKSNRGANQRSTMLFELNGYRPPEGQRWQAGEDVIHDLWDRGYIEFVKGTPFRRYFEDEEGAEHDPFYCFMEIDWSSTSEAGKAELNGLIGNNHGFDTVKPTRLLKTLIQSCTGDNDLIVDFFAGSGTTAHAIMELNKEGDEKRNFILVQIPEAIDENSEAFVAGYKKISDITIERVKRAGQRIHEEKPEVDTGFKVFKLTTSMFPENTYQPDPEKTADENVQALKDHVARAKQQLLFDPTGKETDLLYETLVKQGFMLTMTREQLNTFKDNTVWKVTDGDRSALVCLDVDIKESTITALEGQKDIKFIGLHRAVDTTRKWALTEIFGEALVLI